MPLNTPALKEGIKELLTDMETRSEDAKDEYAQRLATLIEVFVKSGTVMPGIPLQAGSNTGATTGPGQIQ